MKHNEIDPPKLEKGKYLHHKSGKFYEVIDIALHTETGESLVVYRPLYDHSKYEMFARPYTMFIQEVEIDGRRFPRFEKVPDGFKHI